jgi:hypothetical protein
MFSTHTPIAGAGDERLRLSREQRLSVIDDLLGCRRDYGPFLLNTKYMIRGLHPDRTDTQMPQTCSFAKSVDSYRADGERKSPCIFGNQADCTQCGCSVTKMMEAMFDAHDLPTMRMVGRLRTRLQVSS